MGDLGDVDQSKQPGIVKVEAVGLQSVETIEVAELDIIMMTFSLPSSSYRESREPLINKRRDKGQYGMLGEGRLTTHRLCEQWKLKVPVIIHGE